VEVGVSVVIVTYNSAHVIGALLESIPAALDGLSSEVIVVDNASTDGTAELLDVRGDCTVVRSDNVGYAGGVNRGVRESSGRGPILVLNPDLRLDPGSVRRMVGAIAQPGVGVVAPRVLGPDGELQHSLRREPTLARALGLTFTRLPIFSEYCNRARDYERPHDVDWALGAVLLVGRECFDALGGWDESYFLYSEETDFSLRARDRGWTTRYVPAAVATHIGRQSGYNNEIHTMQIVNRVRLYRRRHGRAASYGYLLLAIGSEGYRAALGVEQSRHAVRALLDPARRPAPLACGNGLLPS
jgi:N-acetylglucosaminyl-diphospho-decaprenol L-rhamnosyltransferase